jgi:hypothetical protein
MKIILEDREKLEVCLKDSDKSVSMTFYFDFEDDMCIDIDTDHLVSVTGSSVCVSTKPTRGDSNCE